MRAWLEQNGISSAFFFLTPPDYWPHADVWQEWAKKDLWSHAELAEICAGRVPGTPNRTDGEQIAISDAGEAIARGTCSGALRFVARDDEDTASRMYGTHRFYVPAIAAEWAVTRLDAFPIALLHAMEGRTKRGHNVPAGGDKPLDERERGSLLRIIRALEAMAKLPERGAAVSVELQLQGMGFPKPSEATIRKLITEARALEPDSKPQ